MKAFVTGPCGFIGSHLVDQLIDDGHEVVGMDNMATGFHKFINPQMKFVTGDLRDAGSVVSAMEGCDSVFHLSANADISKGWDDPTRDFKQNVLSTSNVLEAMRELGLTKIMLASSSAVYGESSVVPTPENCPWPIQTSLYGASKVAGEALVQAYCEGKNFEGYIFRFCPVVGERYTHGHIFDFVKRLLADPSRLEVKGNGDQKKSYVYVADVVEGILRTTEVGTAYNAVEIYNVGNPEVTSIKQSIRYICEEMGLTPQVHFLGGDRGWTGDMPMLFPSSVKLLQTGWVPGTDTETGIRKTVQWLLKNRWALEERK